MNIGSLPRKSDFAKLLGQSWTSLTESNIISGFKHTGIYDPNSEIKVNRGAIDRNIFKRSDLERYDREKNQNLDESQKRPTQDTSRVKILQDIQVNESSQSKVENVIKVANDLQPHANVSSTSSINDIVSDNIPAPNINQPSTSGNDHYTSFQELLLKTVRSAKPHIPAKKRRVGAEAEVLTKSDIIQNEGSIKKKVTRKTKKYVKTSSVLSDTSEEPDDISLHDSVDSTDLIFDDEPSDLLNPPNDIEEGDYVIVQFPTKKNARHFVGQVIGKQTGRMEYDVKYLRCVKKEIGKFKWPPTPDISSVMEVDIVYKLNNPTMDRRQLFLSFNVDFSSLNIS